MASPAHTLQILGRATGAAFGVHAVAAWRFFVRNRWRYLGAIAGVGVVACSVMPFDPALLHAIQSPAPAAHHAADVLSRWGETDRTTLLVVVGCLCLAGVVRRTRPAHVAVCVLLAVAVSGIGVNVLRPVFGRARPYSAEAGHFTWFSTRHEFTSFPSGHSSEAWTVATVVVAAWPPAAVVAVPYAVSMLWARMEVNRHFPSDVFGGACWGVLCALPFAYALRRRKAARGRGPPPAQATRRATPS